MKPTLIWTEQAREDLIDIYFTIALENEAAAERISKAIQARIESLADMPRLGVRRSDIRESTRLLVEGNYLIFYMVYPDLDEGPVEKVVTVRIVHGHRNLANLL